MKAGGEGRKEQEGRCSLYIRGAEEGGRGSVFVKRECEDRFEEKKMFVRNFEKVPLRAIVQ